VNWTGGRVLIPSPRSREPAAYTSFFKALRSLKQPYFIWSKSPYSLVGFLTRKKKIVLTVISEGAGCWNLCVVVLRCVSAPRANSTRLSQINSYRCANARTNICDFHSLKTVRGEPKTFSSVVGGRAFTRNINVRDTTNDTSNQTRERTFCIVTIQFCKLQCLFKVQKKLWSQFFSHF
jgi:hypothetical protein